MRENSPIKKQKKKIFFLFPTLGIGETNGSRQGEPMQIHKNESGIGHHSLQKNDESNQHFVKENKIGKVVGLSDAKITSGRYNQCNPNIRR